MQKVSLFILTRRCLSTTTTLTPARVTELLRENEISKSTPLPYIKSLECNQLGSNCPIEDRLRISSVHYPSSNEPTLIMGVFDGHGGGITADLISRRLYNYIALSLHPEPQKLGDLNNILIDLHNSPPPQEDPGQYRTIDALKNFKQEVGNIAANDIATKLRTSFTRCDNDLSDEIQQNLTNPKSSQGILHYYLSAAVSGCCAIVMVIHQGIGYLASAGDCRAVLGIHNKNAASPHQRFSTYDLNEEHNCDNINEIRRLANSHPRSEQNTMIKNTRLLGNLMPFRAFGDFTYKWPVEVIKACGLTQAFGPAAIPSNYKTPPYLIADPDINRIEIANYDGDKDGIEKERWVVMATDGLWEQFDSSRDVVETVIDHSLNACREETMGDYDQNCATHVLRSALQNNSSQYDFGSDTEGLKRARHINLEATLGVSGRSTRDQRDDISLIVMKL